jgi:hypothetical protein
MKRKISLLNFDRLVKQQTDAKNNCSDGDERICDIEHREINQAEIKKVNDISVINSVDQISDGSADDKTHRGKEPKFIFIFFLLFEKEKNHQRNNQSAESGEQIRISPENTECSARVLRVGQVKHILPNR